MVRARLVLAEKVRTGEIIERERLRLIGCDTLTGALSRNAFIERLQGIVYPRATDKAVLLLVDVDHFKSFNDGFGHAAGDEVLRHIVAVARESFPEAHIGRLGGDEFAILMPDGDLETGLRHAADFLAGLRRPATIAGRPMSLGCSIGLAAVPDHACFVDELIVSADLALYESKRRGRGCATAFEGAMMREQRHQRFIERELRAAILLDELELHYQPLVDGAGRTLGVEALVRWRHPLRGMIPPNDFVPIAEQSTLIDMLGEWVLRRAARDAAALPAGIVNVNISGAQLRRDALVATVTSVFAETGCPAERFAFEITEGVALAATPAVLQRLQALRDLGARVMLDDFGSGNCGFATLRSLPVDGIKIDRSYIQALESDPVAGIIVSAVAAIGRECDLEIVAEGIETEAHFTLAKAAGCMTFQGYRFGRPAPLREGPAVPAQETRARLRA
ncbi:putative bifunctional diguanylate cyclase/phosphodiesterase [Aureimonas endophytica]|uniref:putative bifunctional diguanylate cyclase/phosphodiesterase n=1 Tax=Aureimonas endophytica TaxID=2027858 RepID=UPI00166F13AD|nr:EAL domain-containing protein [Aureimonas endophytica]